ncbi:Uncharacterised protein [Raoultella terrigena]|uniref:Uncharacterized protein n=1 Tax=Raoultella terrigena TaxID=577 RepID=A0A4U9D1W9_RAOTE|nr:Uncharacterised protein [Raoultella terrigena]
MQLDHPILSSGGSFFQENLWQNVCRVMINN